MEHAYMYSEHITTIRLYVVLVGSRQSHRRRDVSPPDRLDRPLLVSLAHMEYAAQTTYQKQTISIYMAKCHRLNALL
jgi:hypothetical protein